MVLVEVDEEEEEEEEGEEELVAVAAAAAELRQAGVVAQWTIWSQLSTVDGYRKRIDSIEMRS